MTARLLVAHDAEADCADLVARLRDAGYAVDVADGVGPACFMLRRHDYVVVLADLPGADALAILRAAGRSRPAARVILTLPAVATTPEPALPELSRAAYRCLRHPAHLEDELLPLVAEAIADFSDGAGAPGARLGGTTVSLEAVDRRRGRRPDPGTATDARVPRPLSGAATSSGDRDGQRAGPRVRDRGRHARDGGHLSGDGAVRHREAWRRGDRAGKAANR